MTLKGQEAGKVPRMRWEGRGQWQAGEEQVRNRET